MVSSQQELLDLIKKDVEEHKGLCYPVKAGLLERLIFQNLSVDKLHPNPDDEFSMPEIGPNFRIINEYREIIRDRLFQCESPIDEKLVVEKIYPKGYMIVNGHHRWSAAQLERLKRVPVEIVNLTHDADLHLMLEKSVRDKRVAIDLDEVILTKEKEGPHEEPNSNILAWIYKDRLKIGRTALINALHKMGYDVWVYTRGYYSTDRIEKIFEGYNVTVDGIINGVGRPYTRDDSTRERFEKKYIRSLHIDNDQVSYIDKSTREFISRKVTGDEDSWSKNVIDIIQSLE